MKILAIETSCDETAISIVEADGGIENPQFKVLGNSLSSQAELHSKLGGVVPMMAKREHQKNLIPMLEKTLEESNFLISNPPAGGQFPISTKNQNETERILEREPELLKQFLEFIPTIEKPPIDAIAVTYGPGLEPALWVGVNFAKALSAFWDIPVIPVNHMEGHIVASLLATSPKIKSQKSKVIEFPAIALLVSGGHTELVLVKKWGDYEIIGKTRDDAAGEAFDKTARMLGLPYPGGPEIAKQAENFKKYPLTWRMGGWTRREMEREAFNIRLPRPMIHSKDYDFSFSGLKTAVLYMLKDMKERHINIGDFTPTICNEIQQAIIDVLIAKTIRAAEEFCVKSIILGGGVSANKELGAQMEKAVSEKIPQVSLFLPSPNLTTDNAIMIAIAGYFNFILKKSDSQKAESIRADGNLEL